jgi:DNA-binding NtrC family response regulator
MVKSEPPCILVVTDEPLIRHMVARLLASEGLRAMTAEQGEADFEGYARIPMSLVLVNTYLPDLSGEEVLARVSAAFPGIPVLHIDEALSSGTLPGSFNVEGMLRTIRNLTHSERRQVARTDAGW